MFSSSELRSLSLGRTQTSDVQPEAPSTGSDRAIPLLTVLSEILSADIERPMSSDAASHRKLNHHEPRHARRPYGRRYRSPSAAFGTISFVPRCYRIIRFTSTLFLSLQPFIVKGLGRPRPDRRPTFKTKPWLVSNSLKIRSSYASPAHRSTVDWGYPEQAHDLEYPESPFSRSWRIRDMYEGSFHVTPAVPEVNQ